MDFYAISGETQERHMIALTPVASNRHVIPNIVFRIVVGHRKLCICGARHNHAYDIWCRYFALQKCFYVARARRIGNQCIDNFVNIIPAFMVLSFFVNQVLPWIPALASGGLFGLRITPLLNVSSPTLY